ncbi:MAG: orotidine-5'-phosphate decarboxylase, partial [Pseudomonadales bacterium]
MSNTPAFFERVSRRQEAQNTLLCIGLDPDPRLMPANLSAKSDGLYTFNRAIIDATADVACCYKPQIAFYASRGAEDQLVKTIDYLKTLDIPVLLDAKRGDVGNTANQYAIEVFERYGADAVTINPWMGLDSMAPYLEFKDRGVFILCRTSNAGGADLQNLVLQS